MIKKALVDLEGPVFREFAKRRAAWAAEDAYRWAGPKSQRRAANQNPAVPSPRRGSSQRGN